MCECKSFFSCELGVRAYVPEAKGAASLGRSPIGMALDCGRGSTSSHTLGEGITRTLGGVQTEDAQAKMEDIRVVNVY